jgi:hypothetical protein
MLFTNDKEYFYINFEKWNTRFVQDNKINAFDLTGRTQYKNMNNKKKTSTDSNFVATYMEFMNYVQETDELNNKQNYNLIMNYLYSAKVTMDKYISEFLNSPKNSEDYEKYEEGLYNVFRRLLVVENSAGINLRSTLIKLLREMITKNYTEFGDNLKNIKVVNPELYIGDELMIDIYVFGYIQRLLIPFVSHWISEFKDGRNKNDNDDPLNVVLVRIWTNVLNLSFSKTKRQRIENKIKKKIIAVVVVKEMRNPQFFRLWSRQGFDKNNMMLICYEDFMFRSLFKIVLSDNEKSKGLGFIDGVISNRVNLIFGDRIKEGESIKVLLSNVSNNPDATRREDVETPDGDSDSEYDYIDRGIDEFVVDDKIESLFRLDDGIFDALRGKTIDQVINGNGPMSLMSKLNLQPSDIIPKNKYEFSKTRLHNYVMNIVVGSVMDLSLIQSGIKAKEFNKSMLYIYSYLNKNKYDSLLNVLKNSDLSEITKYVSSSKTDQLELNIKDTQLHHILRQIYSSQLSFSDRDKIFNYVVKICGGVGENQLKRYIADVDERYTEEKINLLDLAKDLMRLIISFSK